MNTQDLSIVVRFITTGVAEGANMLTRHLDRVREHAARLQNGGAMLNAALQAGAALVGGRALASYAQQAEEARRTQEQLRQTLRQTGQDGIPGYAAALEQQGEALKRLTGYEDDHIRNVQRILIAGGVQAADIQRLTALTLDLAAARGISADAAAQTIARGLSGDSVELGRMGIHVDKKDTYRDQLNEAMEKLERAFGGQAARVFESAGPTGRMRVATRELKEELGGLVLVAQQGFAEGLNPALEHGVELLRSMNQGGSGASNNLRSIGRAVGEWAQVLVPAAAVLGAFAALNLVMKVMWSGLTLLRMGWFALLAPLWQAAVAVHALSKSFGLFAAIGAGGAVTAFQVAVIAALGGIAGYLLGGWLDSLDIAGANISDWLAAFVYAWQAMATSTVAQLMVWWEQVKGIFTRLGIFLGTEFAAYWKEAGATIIQSVATAAAYLNKLPGVSIDVGNLDAARDSLSEEARAIRDAGTKMTAANRAGEAQRVAAIWESAAEVAEDQINSGANILANAFARLRGPRGPEARGGAGAGWNAPAANDALKDAEKERERLQGAAKATTDKIAALQLEGMTLDNQLSTLRAQEKAVQQELASRLAILAPLKDAKALDLAREEAQLKTLEIQKDIAAVQRQQFQVAADMADKELQLLELRREAIMANRFLPEWMKQAQSVPVLEQEREKLNEQIAAVRRLLATTQDPTTATLLSDRLDALAQKQRDVQRAMTDNTQLGVWDQWRANIAGIGTQFGSTAQQIAKVFSEPVSTAISSITDNVFALIKSGQSLGTTFANIGQAIIDTFLRMAIQAAAFAAVMAVVNALTGGAPFALGGGFSLAALGLFAAGGFTGRGGKYEPAGIVHRGEFVFDADSTRRLGVPFLESLRWARPGVAAFAGGGPVGLAAPALFDRAAPAPAPAGDGRNVNVLLAFTDAERRRMMRDAYGESYIVDIMKANRHVLGIRS